MTHSRTPDYNQMSPSEETVQKRARKRAKELSVATRLESRSKMTRRDRRLARSMKSCVVGYIY